MDYNLTLIMKTNTFSDYAIAYKLTSTNINSNGTVVPSSEEDMCFLLNVPGEDVLGNGSFSGPTGGNKIHTYNLKFYFPETQNIQNEDFNKIFEAYIKTEEGTKIKSECKIAPRGKLNNIILADN